MNRDWQKFFGRGFVETEDDFGTQGTPPTHPELLDWLGYSRIRRVGLGREADAPADRDECQLIGKSSRWRTDLAERDPQNKLLARQSRLRLDAEIVRDVALSAAGLLTQRTGRASVFPPQPEGVFDFTQDPEAVECGDRRRSLSPRDVHAFLASQRLIRC